MINNCICIKSGKIIEGESIIVSKLMSSIETYECVAENGVGDTLRKVVKISFSGKKFSNH